MLTGYVTDDQKRGLLAGATILAYPSLYEGFGFPVLEGFAAGVPVLTSTAASLPEVAGDAAISVEPDDLGAIEDGLARLFRDAELRERLDHRRTRTSPDVHLGGVGGRDGGGAPRGSGTVRGVWIDSRHP